MAAALAGAAVVPGPAEERYEGRRAPVRSEAPLPVPQVSYGPLYGGPFIPPTVFDRHRVRIRS